MLYQLSYAAMWVPSIWASIIIPIHFPFVKKNFCFSKKIIPRPRLGHTILGDRMIFLWEASLFFLGGGGYMMIEWLWRGYSHGSMFLLGGVCFRFLGLLRRRLPPYLVPLAGAAAITALELFTGLLVNRALGWAVWDYSAQPGNLFGQICPAYSLLWLPLAALAAALDGLMERFAPPRRLPSAR